MPAVGLSLNCLKHFNYTLNQIWRPCGAMRRRGNRLFVIVIPEGQLKYQRKLKYFYNTIFIFDIWLQNCKINFNLILEITQGFASWKHNLHNTCKQLNFSG